MGFFTKALFCGIIAIIVYYMATSRDSLVTVNINLSYDYIIVGTGSAGAVLAARLSEDKDTTVLVIEAGGEDTNMLLGIPFPHPFLQNTSVDWTYYTEPQTHSSFSSIVGNNRHFWPRGKVLGGTSMLNSMAYVRGNKADYDEWEEIGCDGWSYEDVLPYFLKSEDILIGNLSDSKYHHKGGPLAVSYSHASKIPDIFVKAGKELGYEEVDYNGEKQEGFSKQQSTVRNGVRSSTIKEFLRPAMKRENIHVVVNTMATKVVFDDNKRATGIEFIRDGVKGSVKAKKEVIISGGAVNSPQLLMLSGIGPKDHLESMQIPVINDLPVGKNLQDHLYLLIGSEINTTDSINTHPIIMLAEFLKYAVTGKGSFASSGLEGTAFINTDKTETRNRYPDIQIHGYSALSERKYLLLNQDLIKGLFPDEIKNGFALVPIILHPKSRGSIKLKSPDPKEYPSIDPRYLTAREDVDTFIRGIRLVERLIETSAFSSIGSDFKYTKMAACSEHEFRSDAYWECYIRYNALTTYHPTSTCKMGSIDDPSTVVDSELRVKGVKGLRVVDASVMPNIISGNTNAPTIMIAEKAADMIRNKDTVEDIRNYINSFH